MDDEMTEAEAIELLDALDGGDPEGAHFDADAVLLDFVPEKVREAYKRVHLRLIWRD